MNEMEIHKFTFRPLYAKEGRLRCLLNSMTGLAPFRSGCCTESKISWSYRESNTGHLSRCLFATRTELHQILEKNDYKIKSDFIAVYIPVLFIPSALAKYILTGHMFVERSVIGCFSVTNNHKQPFARCVCHLYRTVRPH
jgi:hypothetical protein